MSMENNIIANRTLIKIWNEHDEKIYKRNTKNSERNYLVGIFIY